MTLIWLRSGARWRGGAVEGCVAANVAHCGIAGAKQPCSATYNRGIMRYLLRDTAFAARMLVKSPAFTIAAIVTLALAIGANTAIFTVADTLLLRPFPYRAPE